MNVRSLVAAAVAVMAAVGVLWIHATSAPDRFEVPADHPLAAYAGRTLTDPLEMLAAEADGSSFLLLARDPSLGQAATDFGDPGHAAYRSARIVPAVLTWALGGSPWALAAVVVAGIGAMAAALARLVPSVRALVLGLATVANPGTLATVEWLSSESVANGFGLWGLVAWRSGRRAAAVVCWSMALLSRDTAIVYPVAVFAAAWLQGRRAGSVDRGAAWAVATVAAVYLAWAGVVHARLGRWPWAGDADGNLSPIPFGPLLGGALGRLDGSVVPSLMVLAMVAGGLVGIRRSRAFEPLRALLWTHVLVLAFLGEVVWTRWDYFARLVVPPLIVAVVALAEVVRPAADQQQNTRSTTGVVTPVVSGG